MGGCTANCAVASLYQRGVSKTSGAIAPEQIFKLEAQRRMAQDRTPRPGVFRFRLGCGVIISKIVHILGFSCFRLSITLRTPYLLKIIQNNTSNNFDLSVCKPHIISMSSVNIQQRGHLCWYVTHFTVYMIQICKAGCKLTVSEPFNKAKIANAKVREISSEDATLAMRQKRKF